MNLCVIVDERQILPLLRRVFASDQATFVLRNHGCSLARLLTRTKQIRNQASDSYASLGCSPAVFHAKR